MGSPEQEECEGIRAVGMRTLRKVTMVFPPRNGGKILTWSFPMPLIPIVLNPPFLFLVTCAIVTCIYTFSGEIVTGS
jgi:hypothetical protein